MTRRTWTVAVVALALLASSGSAGAGLSNGNKCARNRSIALSTYEFCFSRIRDSRGALPCLASYVDKWAKFQVFTDSMCIGERWVDNGDGTVTDRLTGLIWEKKTNLDGVANPSDPHDADNVYDWTNDDSDATDEDGTIFTDFLASLNAGDGFAGSQGWRLPTLQELYTLYALQNGTCTVPPCTDPALGPVAIEPYGLYWASGTQQENPAWGFLAEPTPSNGFSAASKADAFNVRAVRGGHTVF